MNMEMNARTKITYVFCLKMEKSVPRKYNVDNVINTNIHIIFDDSY